MASSTSITTTTTTATTMEHRTYWCNSCNTDVSPNPGLLCPNCNSLLLSTNNPNPNPNPNPNSNPLPLPSVTASDDNFLLDSPYLHRLIHHLTHSTDSSSSTTSRYHSPTSKSAIAAIPRVTITSSFLQTDPIILCAVCKDQFVINDETNQLPCNHMYHPDCILPWLSNHNSCPVCRFQMPKETGVNVNVNVNMLRRSRSRVLRLGDLMEDVDDEAMLGIGFSNLHQQYMEPEIDTETLSFGEIGQTVEVDVLPDSDIESVSGWRNWPVNRVDVGDGENVSGWRSWPVNERAVDGVNDGWVDDVDVDVVMP